MIAWQVLIVSIIEPATTATVGYAAWSGAVEWEGFWSLTMVVVVASLVLVGAAVVCARGRSHVHPSDGRRIWSRVNGSMLLVGLILIGFAGLTATLPSTYGVLSDEFTYQWDHDPLWASAINRAWGILFVLISLCSSFLYLLALAFSRWTREESTPLTARSDTPDPTP